MPRQRSAPHRTAIRLTAVWSRGTICASSRRFRPPHSEQIVLAQVKIAAQNRQREDDVCLEERNEKCDRPERGLEKLLNFHD